MGPKKKTPQKTPKGKKGKAKDAKKSEISPAPFVSEREIFLQKEYAVLTEHINTYTQRVRHFQWDNEHLDKEAQQIREISKAYLSYLLKRSLRCQNTIISLNDQNRADLAQIRKEKAELTSQYAAQEKGLQSQLFLLESKFLVLNREVEAMQPWKDLQFQQLTRIRELEKELLVMKVQYMEQMHKVKSRFLQQKAEYEMESQHKIQALAKLAEKEAVRSLIQHTKQVKAEYWRLRQELLNLIRQAQTLNTFRLQLRRQQQQLLREHCHSEDLAHMRHWLRPRKAQLFIPSDSSFRCIPLSNSRLSSPQGTNSQLPEGKDPGSPTSAQQADKACTPNLW
ncbi:coiled-coil domain-containing protein 166 [Tiliqua scincoides]|uniref:coiled-coil domain-containing protein 166 n=1 Tax=Tiliqua scincoides TaxID=71010 RepID=UPI003462F172